MDKSENSVRAPMMRADWLRSRTALILLAAAVLAGCSSAPHRGGGGGRGGGYYQDDGPEAHPPANLDKVPDPLPQVEPLASGANKPYVVLGKRYVPGTSLQTYSVRGLASWYGRKFNGARTSNGEIYDMYAMTAAHPTLPIPSYARVTRVATGKSIIVRVNDRGPFHEDRVIDLSYTAAYKLGILGPGSAEVIVESLGPEEIARIRAERSGDQAVAAATTLQVPQQPSDDAVASTLPVALAEQPAQVHELAPLAPAGPASGAAYPSNSAYASGSAAASGPTTASASAPSTSGFANSGSANAAPLPPAASGGAPLPASTAPAPALPSANAFASTAPSGIFLQLGAFSGLRNAQDLLARVQAKLGDWTEPIRIVDTDDHLHRVHVGPYASRESALAAAQILRARIDIVPVVVAR
jgi:rare lipoprotein A